LRDHIENVGKQPLEQSGKYRVNGNDEENFLPHARITTGVAIASAVIPGRCEASNPESRDSGFALTRAPE
jgi:hypothetical protein